MKRIQSIALLIGMVALVLTACAPATPQVVEKAVVQTVVVEREVAVEKQVVETVVVEKKVVETVVVEKAAETGPKGTLTIGIPVNVDTLDPSMASQVYIGNTAMTPYEGLTHITPEGDVVGLLAEKWDILDDLTYIFHLRKGVRFHNGEEFNADSVIWSWQYHSGNKSAGHWKKITEITKIDDFTIELKTGVPEPVLLKKPLAGDAAAIFPAKYGAEVGAEGLNEKPIGTGPYLFKEWIRGQAVIYEANPDYWGDPDKVGVERVVWKSITEPSARVAALQAGEIDIALLVPPSDVGILMDDPTLSVNRSLGTRPFYVMFDNISSGRGTPIEDNRVRQAMIYAVDRQAIVDAIFLGNGVVINSLIGPVQFGHDPSIPPFPYDPEKAQQLLTEAGFPNGFEIGLACPSGAYANDVQACQAIVGYLNEAGIKTELFVREPSLHWDLQAKHEFEPMFFDGVGDRVQDPTSTLVVLEEDNIWTAWIDEKLNELIHAGGSTVDQEKRKQVYSELQRYVQDEPPCIPLWQVHNFTGVSKNVQGYVPYSNELVIVWGVRVSQ